MGGQHDPGRKPNDFCRNTPVKVDKSINPLQFGRGYSLRIAESIERNEYKSDVVPEVSGQLRLRPCKASEGSIEIEMTCIDERLRPSTRFSDEDGHQIVEIISSRALDWWDCLDSPPDIQILVTIFVPPVAFLDSLEIELAHLDVKISKGLVMGVVSSATIKSVSGNIKSPRTIQLGVNTINTKIKLKELLTSIVKRGKLEKNVAPRDYQVSISTRYGKIKANVVGTSYADIRSHYGELDINVHPLLSKKKEETTLKTRNVGGSTTVTVHEAVATAKRFGRRRTYSPSLSNFMALHSSIGGQLDLCYPATLKGKFFVKNMAHDNSVVGEDIEITEQRQDGWRLVTGKKGDGESYIEVYAMAGNVKLRFGKEE
ncbi:hypothetical protein NOR_04028 [Metarhizium rileyi]|uniref:Uncharacterized protein n=1 Tax=Metarhizium rileyi (strain RCEF 4871) TaxID=1649241 RepID=A0A162LTC4_METRR|nr:hypothetical protein NOR_04028 [Metarhizium rileyi RCEF 4871]